MRPTGHRRNARGLRDREAFEGVRMRAGALFAVGHDQAEVAHQLGRGLRLRRLILAAMLVRTRTRPARTGR